MKSAFRFFNSCYSRFMSALDDASSSGCQYLLVEEIKTKKAAGCYPCGRFRAHIAITAACRPFSPYFRLRHQPTIAAVIIPARIGAAKSCQKVMANCVSVI